MSSDDTFLSRWSKRKREALAQPADAAKASLAKGDEAGGEQTEQGEEEPFDLSLLPDLESLSGDSDIQAFLHKAVPDALRNAALRKVWALDPAVRNYVGEALDYAYDWNTPGGIPGFGETLSSEQSADFVRNLLAGPEADEKVIAHVAAQQNEPPSPSSPEAHDEHKDDISDNDQQPIEKNDFNNQSNQTVAQPEDTVPLIPRRRHGGALPV